MQVEGLILATKNSRTLLTLLLLIGLLVVARLYDLEADPPTIFADNSQSVTTDPGHLTWHARNMVLFENWELFGYGYWLPFKVSAVTAMSYLVYSFYEVSRVAANLSGVILQLLGIVLFLLALRKLVSRRALLMTLFFISANYALAIYGRLPFSENGLMVFVAAAFFVYAYWFERPFGKILVGLLIGMGALLGKTFGIFVLIAPILALWVSSDKNKISSTLMILLSAGLPLLVFELVFSSDVGMLAMVLHHANRAGEAPGGLLSVTGFFEHLIGFSARAKFIAYMPVAALMLWLMLVQIIRGEWRHLIFDRGTIYLLGWTIGSILCFAPFNYLPLRYFMPLMLPVAALAAIALETLIVPGIKELSRPGYWRFGILGILNWMLAYYLIIRLVTQTMQMSIYYEQVWYALPFGILMTLLMWQLRRVSLSVLSGKTAGVIATVALVVSGGLFVYQSYDWYDSRTYGVKETTQDLREILGPDAVISGPYGAALAGGDHFRSVPYYPDDASTTKEDVAALAEVCQQLPITHLVVSREYWSELINGVPQMKQARPVARYWVRNKTLVVVRVSELFGNPEAAAYHESLFEQAYDMFAAQNVDSAWTLLKEFDKSHPDCKASLLGQYYVSMGRLGVKAAEPYIRNLVRCYPTDFSVQTAAALYYHHMAKQTGNAMLESKAIEHLETAIEYNPVSEEPLRQLYTKYGPETNVL